MKYSDIMKDNPITELRKTLPIGKWDFPGADSIYSKLSNAALKMAAGRHLHLSDLHIMTMAVMGSGDEETVKAHLGNLRQYGWIN